jgi:fatty acid desaturase
MNKKNKELVIKISTIILIVMIIILLILATLNIVPWIIFWVFAAVIGFYSYKILPKINNK